MTALEEGFILNNRYRLVAHIADGGMSNVWEAYDTQLSRPVAIKFARPEIHQNRNLFNRFRNEARAAANLHHRNIIATYDAGNAEINGKTTPYLVMERIYGPTLRAAMQFSTFNENEIRAIAIELANGLEYAHENGFLHGDIKPINVLLAEGEPGEEQHPVIADFGLSTTAGPQWSQVLRSIPGSAAYIAPELISGSAPSRQSDIYSLGALLFELATGSPPLLQPTEKATLEAKVAQVPPPLFQLRPDFSREFAAIVDKTLAREPEERFSTVAAMRTAISYARANDVATEHGVVTPTHPQQRPIKLPTRSRKPLKIMLAFTVLTIGIAIVVAIAGGFGNFSNSTPHRAHQMVTISAVSAFDPYGDQHEGDRLLANLTDNNPESVWSTDHYNSTKFGGLKSGVGIIATIPSANITTATLTNVTPSAHLQIYVSTSSTMPTQLSDFGSPVGELTSTDQPLTFTFPSRHATQVLVWITDLGPSQKVNIGELSIHT